MSHGQSHSSTKQVPSPQFAKSWNVRRNALFLRWPMPSNSQQSNGPKLELWDVRRNALFLRWAPSCAATADDDAPGLRTMMRRDCGRQCCA